MRRLDVEVAQKQQRALELRNVGVNYDRIAAELGYKDRSGAWRAVKAALDRAIVEPAQEQRILQNNRLDLLTRQALAAVLAGDLDQIQNVLRIEKRRSDLWGLDAPKNVEVSGPAGAPIRTDVGELLLERLKALQAGVPLPVASGPALEEREPIEAEASEEPLSSP
jgi:hypothetical protein